MLVTTQIRWNILGVTVHGQGICCRDNESDTARLASYLGITGEYLCQQIIRLAWVMGECLTDDVVLDSTAQHVCVGVPAGIQMDVWVIRQSVLFESVCVGVMLVHVSHWISSAFRVSGELWGVLVCDRVCDCNHDPECCFQILDSMMCHHLR